MDMDGYPVSSTYWRDNNDILQEVLYKFSGKSKHKHLGSSPGISKGGWGIKVGFKGERGGRGCHYVVAIHDLERHFVASYPSSHKPPGQVGWLGPPLPC
jgi:hypothetical protein